MQGAPDVQAFAAPRPYKLTHVGVRGVKKPVTIQRPDQEPMRVVATFDLFVDLPATQKGTHMSRNVEALADVLDEEIERESRGLENFSRRLVERLLEKHEYASRAEVHAEADFFLTRTNPGGKPTVESYRILAYSEGDRGEAPTRRIGVEVVGMSACPCAMETARHKFTKEGRPPNPDIPFLTHNQRNRVRFIMGVPAGQDVEAATLVDLCEAALSAPTYELLKRGDEGDLVIQAHHAPRFVEDVVREALHLGHDRFSRLGDDVEVFASSEAEESIHKHNAYAERFTTMAELGEEMQ